MISRTFSLCLFSLVATACHRAENKPALFAPKSVTVSNHAAIIQMMTKKGMVTFEVELAKTEPERERGLMERESLAAKAGMLFFFAEEKVHSFWMKNTLIPLDLIFFDKNWFVTGVIENMTPLSLESRSITKPSQYVLEINAGLIKQEGIAIGDVAVFVEEVRKK